MASLPHHTEPEGVLLVGHGTRDPQGTEQFFELGRQLAAAMPDYPTESALLEFQRPTIAEAWETLTRQGVRHVHVAPLLLFAAGHAKQDIPNEIAACQSRSNGVVYDQSRPLSRHPALIDLVSQRIGEALDQLPESPDETAIVMVGRGNRDPCAQSDMRLLTHIVHHRIRSGFIATAFYAMAAPKLPDVLDTVATDGRWRRIVVYPHLLFQGRLLDAIHQQVDDAIQRHPHVPFSVAEYLGPHPRVAQAIRGRIEQAANATYAQYQ